MQDCRNGRSIIASPQEGGDRLIRAFTQRSSVSDDWKQRAMAACLWAGDGAALSHKSAALLWGLDGIVTSLVEITTPRALSDPRVMIHRSRLLTGDHVTRVGGIPVTSPTRTLLNLS